MKIVFDFFSLTVLFTAVLMIFAELVKQYGPKPVAVVISAAITTLIFIYGYRHLKKQERQ